MPTDEKESAIKIRIDPDLAEQAKDKARSYGGLNLSAVLRALLRKWIDQGTDIVSLDDIAAEAERAPKTPRKKKQKTAR